MAVVFGFIGMRLRARQMLIVCVEAEGEDVLVVHASGEFYCELYRGVVGVQRGDAGAVCSANHWYMWLWPTMHWGSRDRGDHGLLPAEVCAEG